MRFRHILICALIFGGLASTWAAAQKVERIGAPPASVPNVLRQAVGDAGYRVVLDGGWTAEFWFAKQLKTEKKDVPGALYPKLTNGEFVGVVSLAQAMTDYRGQNLPAGTYTLRYEMLPQDGNHLGVAPNHDFLLTIPAANDAQPDENYAYKKMVALSAKSTGSNHPGVVAMESAGEAGGVAKQERETVFSVAVGGEKLGIVVKETAGE